MSSVKKRWLLGKNSVYPGLRQAKASRASHCDWASARSGFAFQVVRKRFFDELI